MVEALEAMSGFFIVILAIGILISYFFIWIGTKVSRGKNFTLRKAFLAAILSSLITYAVTTLFYILPNMRTIFGYFMGIFICFFVIKIVFHASYKGALLIWVFYVPAQFSAVIIGSFLFVGGMKDLFKII